MNLRVIDKFHYLLGEMESKGKYLENYWYNLKYIVHALHAIYRLLYKILKKYGNEGMCSKNRYHNLIYGPRPIKENKKIFHELCRFISIQKDLIAAQIRYYLNVAMQDTMTRLLFRLTKFMETVISNENAWTGYFVQGLPVKLNWL